MKNITLSANERIIEKAREKARKERTTLNALFREWLRLYVGRSRRRSEYAELMAQLSYVEPGRTFSREDLNER